MLNTLKVLPQIPYPKAHSLSNLYHRVQLVDRRYRLQHTQNNVQTKKCLRKHDKVTQFITAIPFFEPTALHF